MLSAASEIPAYAVWALLLVFLSVGLAHLVRVRREKYNATMKISDEERKASDQFATFTTALLQDIEASSDLRKVWSDSLPELRALIQTLAAQKKPAIEAEFAIYESIDPKSLFKLSTFDVLDRSTIERAEVKKTESRSRLCGHLERMRSIEKG